MIEKITTEGTEDTESRCFFLVFFRIIPENNKKSLLLPLNLSIIESLINLQRGNGVIDNHA